LGCFSEAIDIAHILLLSLSQIHWHPRKAAGALCYKVGVGIYVHVPFCVHKCGYCDFNSWAEERPEPQRQWFLALEKQVSYWAPRLKNWKFETLFFGGGTPSLLSNDLILKTMSLIQGSFDISPTSEITWEVNPETLTAEKLEVFERAGVNRLSMGVQSFQDRHLERLERRARRADNLRALGLLKSFWKGRWSLDLMFGLPEQSLLQWDRELEEALDFKPRHVSAYQLTLTTERSKNWKQPSEDELLKQFLFTRDKLGLKGLPFYEISNFSMPGEESRHNLKYWDLQPFLGLGPGAAGLLSGRMLGQPEKRWGFHQKNPDHFEKWSRGVGADSEEAGTWLVERSGREHLEELLMMGLRLRRGIQSQRIQGFIGSDSTRFTKFLEENQGFIFVRENEHRLLNTHLQKLFGILDQIPPQALDFQRLDPTF
jgi:oxygen-independent coproporphyrinogen III oxidase